MGQFLSYIPRPSPLPPLFKLPTEMLLLIASQLSSSPESLVALSLTCKSLSSICNRDAVKLGDKSRQQLLLLLEKDLGDGFFYCPSCRKLHRFPQQWQHLNVVSYNCFRYQIRNSFGPSYSSQYRLYAISSFVPDFKNNTTNRSYIQGRLVMNRHFHGSSKGLPLESLAYSAIAVNKADEPVWQEASSARIIGDELFLCITHSLAGDASKLRTVIDRGRFGICKHLRGEYFRCMPELTEPKVVALETDGSDELLSPFQTCRHVPGSCTVCLTDCIVTVEAAEVCERIRQSTGQISSGPLINGWSITITSYHQMGQLREPEDWMWVRLTQYPDVWDYLKRSPPTQQRDVVHYPPGVIREKWETGEPLV